MKVDLKKKKKDQNPKVNALQPMTMFEKKIIYFCC